MQKRNKSNKKPKNQLPAAFVKQTKTRGPRTMRGSANTITITNEEYIGDINLRMDFAVVTHAVNPGLDKLFRWLAPIANNYEFYTFKKLRFIYKPMVGTATAGAVMMAFDFDSADGSPASKQSMMSYKGAVQGPVFQQLVIDASSANLHSFVKQRFTRGGVVPSGKDVKTYDVANLFVSASGQPLDSAGSLYVDYVVTFDTPHTPADAPYEDSAYVHATSTRQAPFNAVQVLTNANPAVPVVETTAQSFIIKKAGEYMLNELIDGTGLTGLSAAARWTPVANSGATVTGGNILINGTGTQMMQTAKLSVPKDDTTFNWVEPAAWTLLQGYRQRFSPFANSLPINP